MRDDLLEEFCIQLPRKVIQAFRTITANKGEEPGSVIAQLLQSYVDRHKEVSVTRVSVVIEVYVKSLLKLWINWPPARELEADEFIDLVIQDIHKRVVVTDDQAIMVAYRIWQELRQAPSQADEIPEDDTGPDDHDAENEPA